MDTDAIQVAPRLPSLSSLRSLWTSQSWRNRKVAQSIDYAEQERLEDACSRLRLLPSLVALSEVDRLNAHLEKVATGRAFIIQGGDCAEAFNDVNPTIVGLKQSLLVEQANILAAGLRVPVIAIGRIAGQYSKPRSKCHETLSCGSVVNAYRGDNVNTPHKQGRLPDPERMLLGCHYAAASMSMLRMGQTADHKLGETFFTSHEALHLPLEEALTRNDWNTSAHMLWIGERSRTLDGAHVEYVRGLKNPVGIKLGPTTDPADVVELLDLLDPERRPGKIILITRFGASSVAPTLPRLIQAVQKTGHRPVWLCDPMHGNTFATKAGVKTRSMRAMLKEVSEVHRVHQKQRSRLGGLHLEQTGEEVTECVESEDDQGVLQDYRSLCDPRLSRSQALRLVGEYASLVEA